MWSEEEKQSIIEEYNLYKKTCCPDCRGLVAEEGLIAYEAKSINSWESPPEYKYHCPHCDVELWHQDLDEQTFEEWAYEEGVDNTNEFII